MTEVGHFVVLGSEGLEPGLEAELLLVVAHQHIAKPELVLGAGHWRLGGAGHWRLGGHGGDPGTWSEAAGFDSLVSSPFQHDFNVT